MNSLTEWLYLLGRSTQNTLTLALAALCIGLPLALLIASLSTSRLKLLQGVANGFTLVLRSLPEMLVLLLAYTGITQLLFWLTQHYIQLSAFWCAAVALALIFAAYSAQIVRGALQAVAIGQREAGLALAMKERTIFLHLLLPQAWRYALPGLGNQWLVLLKDTALVSLIGVNDLMQQTRLIIALTHKPFTHYITACVIYLLITLISQRLLYCLKQRASHFEHH